MRITEAQQTNPLWHALRADYVKRLALLRNELEALSLSELRTVELRGRIAEVKRFLDMDSPEPETIVVSGLE